MLKYTRLLPRLLLSVLNDTKIRVIASAAWQSIGSQALWFTSMNEPVDCRVAPRLAMTKRLNLVPLLSVLLFMPIVSNADELDVEQLMNDLEKQLQVSQEKYQQLKPELESALQAKTREFSSSLDAALERGVAGLAEVGEQYEAASKASSEKLQELMESDEAKQFRAFLAGLDEQALSEGRDKLVAEFIALLELSSEQLEVLQPLIREKLEQFGVILKRYINEGENNFEQFRVEFEAEALKNIEQFKQWLNPEQFKKYEDQINKIEKTIETDLVET